MHTGFPLVPCTGIPPTERQRISKIDSPYEGLRKKKAAITIINKMDSIFVILRFLQKFKNASSLFDKADAIAYTV